MNEILIIIIHHVNIPCLFSQQESNQFLIFDKLFIGRAWIQVTIYVLEVFSFLLSSFFLPPSHPPTLPSSFLSSFFFF